VGGVPYLLYLFDVNYHFGNAFVLIHEALGVEFGLETRVMLSVFSGVYEVPESGTRLDRQLPEALETVGHVSMEASTGLLLLLTVLAVGFGMFRFHQMDV
jgi:hypothetical protein